jgi:acetone carboxylase beta subunit
VEDAAAGVIELLDLTLSEYLRANISAKGYNPAEFTCFSYGGAGPVHTYGYTEGVGFKDVVVPAWAAGFSAFGCACADFEYRYDKSVDLGVAQLPASRKAAACQTLQQAWEELALKVIDEFVINGYKPEDVLLIPGYKMQYMGQLNDLEIVSPVTWASTAELGPDRRGFRDHLWPGLCHCGALAGAGLLHHRRHPARHGVTQKPVLPEDPDAGPTPPQPPAWAPARSTATKNGRSGAVEDGRPEGRQSHHRPGHHRIRCHHLRRARRL